MANIDAPGKANSAAWLVLFQLSRAMAAALFPVAWGMGSAMTTAAASCCATLGFQTCRCAGSAAVTASTRLAYVLLFFAGQITSWVLRDFAKPLLAKLPWIVRVYSGEPPDSWFGEQAVLRVALGNALFFAGLAVMTAGVQTNVDARYKHVHKGHWVLKCLAWALLLVLPFLLPNSLVAAFGAWGRVWPAGALRCVRCVHAFHGVGTDPPSCHVWSTAWVARLASGVFLVVQMIILLDFAYSLNEAWVAKESTAWLVALIGTTLACFAGGLTLIGLDYTWFKPPGAGECSLNVFLVTITLLSGIFTTIGALHPAVTHGSALCSGVIFIYNAYLITSALSSEPPGYACNGRPQRLGTASGNAGAASGMALALLSVAYSAARAGSSDAFRLNGDDETSGSQGIAASSSDDESEAGGNDHYRRLGDSGHSEPLLDSAAGDGSDVEGDAAAAGEEGGSRRRRRRGRINADNVRPVRYNVSFFHAIFALASCYTAMLMTDWGSGQGTGPDQIGIGWASVWVKAVSTWVTALLYSWTLVAPLVLEDRVF